MDRCAACGAPSSGQAFCAACGSDLRGQAAGAHWQAAATAYPGQSGYPAPGYAGYPQAQPQRSPVWVAVAGALVLAGLACIVAWFALGRTEARPAAAPAQVAATPAPTQAPSVAVPAATPAPGGQANAPAPAPATVTSSVTVAPAAPREEPVYTTTESQLPYGSYVLVLDSLPKSRYSLASAYGKAGRIVSATVIDSSNTPGLNSGYWAVIHERYFWTKSDATSWCSSHGRSVGGSCYPRRLRRGPAWVGEMGG